MTIAAGFLFDKGLLLCSDTQYTGQIKLLGSKIFPYEYSDGSKSVFVGVGHMMYTRMCVQLMQYSIEDIPPSERTIGRIHSMLVAGVTNLHQGHLFKHPRQDAIEAQFLIGIWAAKDKSLAFFSTEETAVVRMYGYDVKGSSESLDQRIIRQRYQRVRNIREKPKHTETEARAMAMDALKESKQYDPYCGGDDECMVLKETGEMLPVGRLFINPSKSKGARRREDSGA